MTWLIGQIVLRTGLGSLLASVAAYALIAALAGGGVWAWSQHKFNAGYNAGSAHERIAWEETRKRDLAKQAARIAADQARIDQIEADYQVLQQQAAESQAAQAALEEALRDADQKPVMPKSISKALNGVR